MGWKRGTCKGKDVWIEVDAGGQPLVQGGRVPVRYSDKAGSKTYRAGVRNVELTGAEVLELPDGVSAVAALGWTLGGVVTLEYDESPVGAYREYVTMGALVTKRGAVGQWGSRLCVSTPTAEAVCREVWGVPAQLADIELCEEGEALAVERPPPPSTGAEYFDGDGADGAAPVPIRVSGWAATRSAAAGARASRTCRHACRARGEQSQVLNSRREPQRLVHHACAELQAWCLT